MKIICPSCHVPVAAEDVELSTGLAKCRTCNNVFRFSDVPDLAPWGAARPRPPMEKPRSVIAADANGMLTLRYRWFTPKYFMLAFFCLFWDGFLIFWYTIAFNVRNPIMVFFPILHVVVGILITYATVAGFVNSTTVRIDGSRLRVDHHPLPWSRRLDLGIGDVKQLFCDETISQGRYGYSRTYSLNALMSNGARKKILANLDTPELPLYLEQHAEAWLRIRDEAVIGELAR